MNHHAIEENTAIKDLEKISHNNKRNELYRHDLKRLAQEVFIHQSVIPATAYQRAAEFLAYKYDKDIDGKTIVDDIEVKYSQENASLHSSGLRGVEVAMTISFPAYPSIEPKRIVGSHATTTSVMARAYVNEQLTKALEADGCSLGTVVFKEDKGF